MVGFTPVLITATSMDTWKAQTMPLDVKGQFRILFEGIRGDSYDGDLAIDDIYFEVTEKRL